MCRSEAVDRRKEDVWGTWGGIEGSVWRSVKNFLHPRDAKEKRELKNQKSFLHIGIKKRIGEEGGKTSPKGNTKPLSQDSPPNLSGPKARLRIIEIT